MNLSLTGRLRLYRTALPAMVLCALYGCSSSSPPNTPTPTVSSVAVTGAPATPAIGQTAPLTATATYSNGTTANVTSQATWESSNTSVATVSPAGVVSFLAAGSANVRATFQSVVGTASVTVAPPAPTVTGITLSGVGTSATVGQTGNLVATATYSDNTTAVVTSQVTWSSSNTSIATVSGIGAVSFVGDGEVDLRASLGAVTASLRVTVTSEPRFSNLQGTVRDAVSSLPIEGVLVTVKGGPNDGRSTQTDSSGVYRFTDLRTGSFALEFTSDKPYVATTVDVTLTENNLVVDVSLNPNVVGFYGKFNITLTILQQTCEPPPVLTGFGPGTLELSGNSNGTNLSVKITEREVSRTYTGGRMNVDGTFNGGTPPGTFFPGAIRLLHEISSTISGAVKGTGVSGTEFMIYTQGCQPGAIINIAFSGNK